MRYIYKLIIQKHEAKICLIISFILSLLVKFSKIIIDENTWVILSALICSTVGAGLLLFLIAGKF